MRTFCLIVDQAVTQPRTPSSRHSPPFLASPAGGCSRESLGGGGTAESAARLIGQLYLPQGRLALCRNPFSQFSVDPLRPIQFTQTIQFTQPLRPFSSLRSRQFSFRSLAQICSTSLQASSGRLTFPIISTRATPQPNPLIPWRAIAHRLIPLLVKNIEPQMLARIKKPDRPRTR